MCGIVGYIGARDSLGVMLDGLKRLEYRGYDSAGVAVLNDGAITVVKEKGYIRDLEALIDTVHPVGGSGIGHTRWATHGPPSRRNAHPHTSCDETVAVVHNGIIENHMELRRELEERGHTFRSETDTEVIVHLIEERLDDGLFEAVRRAIERLQGSFAIVALSSTEPRRLVAARHDSPLVVGQGDGESFVASDIPAILPYTRTVLIVENGQMVVIDDDGIRVSDFDGSPCDGQWIEVTWDAEAAEKGGFEDFMLKEIHEQPQAVADTIRGRIKDGHVVLEELGVSPAQLANATRVVIVACGTSYYAGLVARNAIESLAGIPVEVEISSEFRYRPIVLPKETLVVVITQSGETADTLASLREVQRLGHPVVAVTNVVGSTAAREADAVLYTHAGPEIGVAATKTLTAQMAALFLLAIGTAAAKGMVTADDEANLLTEIERLPALIEEAISKDDAIQVLATRFFASTDFLFLGRGYGLPAALEGALKLKEISYIHAEGYPAGEMKHGPIALIDETLPVVVVATQDGVYEKILANIEEVRARKGHVIAVAEAGDERIEMLADDVIVIPSTLPLFSPILAVIPLQLFAYHIAKGRGLNVDQPRNLAKSVTVE